MVRVPLPPAVIVAAGVLGAALAGSAMAHGVGLGIAVALALLYVPLVLISLPLGIVLWVPLAFLNTVDLNGAPQLAGVLIIFAWLGTLVATSSEVPSLIRCHGRLLAAQAMLIGWVILSTTWASQPAVGSALFVSWLVTGVILLILVTTFFEPRHIRLLAGAVVVGAVASVLIGLVEGSLQSADSAVQSAGEARFTGGTGDPNVLAAQTIPALVLAVGLAFGGRGLARLALVPVAGVLIVGFAATQSRGGLVAAVVATLAYLIVARAERGWVVAFVLCAIGAGFGWFSLNPDAAERVTSFDGSGTGRSELWTVAGSMWQDHPLVGVGLEGFTAEAVQYARTLGPLEYSQFITEKPHVAHNTYLQLLAETGIVGLLLFLGVVLACLRAAWLAAKRFDASGDNSMAILARAVVVAGMASLTASAFISNPADRRTWVLLALGPALLTAASRRPALAPYEDVGDPVRASGVARLERSGSRTRERPHGAGSRDPRFGIPSRGLR